MPSPAFDPLPDQARPALPGTEDPAFGPLFVQRASPVNWFLIAGSVVVFLWSSFGEDQNRLLPLFISLESARSAQPLFEVRHGEVWRLFTPAFIHFGLPHIGFNMLNLIGLGNILERRLNSWNYLWLVSGIAVFSNLAQYFIYGDFHFGGMSGVVYGLIGYIWMRGKYDQTFGLAIPQQMIGLALIWFVVCFTGFLGPIANGAHGAGLVLGALWGIADARNAMARARLLR